VFIEQLMADVDGPPQTYAKAIEEYRRAAIDKLEASIEGSEKEAVKNISRLRVKTGHETNTNLLRFPRNMILPTGTNF
jgi:hypothetical protein